MIRSPLLSLASSAAGVSPIVRGCGKPPLTPSRYAAYDGDEYSIEETLGSGAFGLVTKCRSSHDGTLVAMKTIDRFRLHTPTLRKAATREIHILQNVV